MATSRGNRIETVSVKFSDREKLEIEEIANLHDRGNGYIVRELMYRGLALYKQDGILKLSDAKEKAITTGNQKGMEAGELKPQTRKKKNVA